MKNKSFVDQVEEFKREIAILSQLNHPNIVQFHGVSNNDTNEYPYYIITELLSGGTLYDLIAKNPQGMHFDEIIRVSQDILSGLEYLHDKMHGIHRDLKPANILFTGEGVAKLADVGLIKLNLKDRQSNTIHIGTPLYMAPEVASYKDYTDAADMWPFGLIVVEMTLGSFDRQILEAQLKIILTKMPDVYYIASECTKELAHKRLTASQANKLLKQKPATTDSKASSDISYNSSGYRKFQDPQTGNWEFTHRRVAEKKIGREIVPGQHVHHINKNKNGNTVGLLDKQYY